eukprot:720414-Amphidinium_carterae.1
MTLCGSRCIEFNCSGKIAVQRWAAVKFSIAMTGALSHNVHLHQRGTNCVSTHKSLGSSFAWLLFEAMPLALGLGTKCTGQFGTLQGFGVELDSQPRLNAIKREKRMQLGATALTFHSEYRVHCDMVKGTGQCDNQTLLLVLCGLRCEWEPCASGVRSI